MTMTFVASLPRRIQALAIAAVFLGASIVAAAAGGPVVDLAASILQT